MRVEFCNVVELKPTDRDFEVAGRIAAVKADNTSRIERKDVR